MWGFGGELRKLGWVLSGESLADENRIETKTQSLSVLCHGKPHEKSLIFKKHPVEKSRALPSSAATIICTRRNNERRRSSNETSNAREIPALEADVEENEAQRFAFQTKRCVNDFSVKPSGDQVLSSCELISDKLADRNLLFKMRSSFYRNGMK